MGPYNASKAAVVALSETLRFELEAEGSHVGVSVLCPSWVRTNILDSERNWPAGLGERPADTPTAEVFTRHVSRAIDEAEARVREAVPAARLIYLEPDIHRDGEE